MAILTTLRIPLADRPLVIAALREAYPEATEGKLDDAAAIDAIRAMLRDPIRRYMLRHIDPAVINAAHAAAIEADRAAHATRAARKLAEDKAIAAATALTA